MFPGERLSIWNGLTFLSPSSPGNAATAELRTARQISLLSRWFFFLEIEVYMQALILKDSLFPRLHLRLSVDEDKTGNIAS